MKLKKKFDLQNLIDLKIKPLSKREGQLLKGGDIVIMMEDLA